VARDLTSGMQTVVQAAGLVPIFLADLEFDSQPLRVWTGYGNLTWNGMTFLGAGDLGDLSPIEETQEAKAVGITMTLAGVAEENVSLAMNEDYQGRAVTIYFAAFDQPRQLVTSPYQLFKGRMDVFEIDDSDPENIVMTMSAENSLRSLSTPNVRRYTDADQKMEHPTDDGFGQVKDIQDVQIVWGKS